MPETDSQRPEDLTFISGIIVVSPQAERAAAFYRDILGLPLVAEQHGDTQPHWGCELGDIHFAIHPAEDYSDDPAEAPSPIKMAFMVFDLGRMVEWLTKRGVELCYPPTQLGGASQITAIRDPDGNLVELTQLGPSWLEHLKSQRGEGNDLIAHWSTRTSAASTNNAS